MKHRVTTSILLYIFSCFIIQAQHTPRFSQFMVNEFLINPSVTGNDGQTSWNITARKEWIGFGRGVHTPESYSFSIQNRILKRKPSVKKNLFGKHIDKSDGRVGLGFNIFTDANGIFKQNGIGLTYAYHVRIWDAQVSLGLAFSLFQLQLNSENLRFKDEANEIFVIQARSTSWIPDFNAGISCIKGNFIFGISATQLLQSRFLLGESSEKSLKMSILYKRNYYFISSYKNSIGSASYWEYEPSFMLRMYDVMTFNPQLTTPKTQADALLRLIYSNRYWAGVGYRTSDEYIFMFGIRYHNLLFNYSFDYGNNALSQYSYGTHEFSVTARFGDSARRYKWMDRY